MYTLHQALYRAMSWITPLGGISPWIPLTLVSLVIAAIAMAVYKYASPQKSIGTTKNRLIAYLLEFRLYEDDFLGIFNTLGRILSGTCKYLALSLIPVAVLLIPVTLIIIQLAAWYEWRPFRPDEQGRLTVQYGESQAPSEPARPSAPGGITISDVPFVSEADREAVWRFSVNKSTEGVFTVAGQSKSIVSGNRFARISPVRLQSDAASLWLYPLEKPLSADSKISALRVNYPARTLRWAGINVDWIIALLVLTIIFGLILKKPFNVEF